MPQLQTRKWVLTGNPISLATDWFRKVYLIPFRPMRLNEKSGGGHLETLPLI